LNNVLELFHMLLCKLGKKLKDKDLTLSLYNKTILNNKSLTLFKV